MRRAHGGALLLIWGIGAAAFGANACASEARLCTLVGCDTGDKFQFYLPELTTREVNVEACRNAQCWQAQWLLEKDEGTFLLFEDGRSAQLQIRALTTNTGFSVDAYFPVTDASEVLVGDAMRVTFTDADGTQILAVSATTRSISDSYPNGPDCAPSPCRLGNAELDVP